MGLFERFPYTNFHDLNLTWILNELKTLEHTINEFVSINALKYADPIQWNIVTQYEKNTIVIDPLTGTAYISVQPVPSGVALTNTDYWTVVFDLGSFVTRAAKNFCSRYEEATTLTATFASSVNDWLIWGDTLYYALVNITAGDSYVVDSNIKQFTMEDVIGHIQDLNTTDKTNLVAAINEVLLTLQTTAGDLDNLSTTDKSNLVAAINEVLLTLQTIAGDLDNLSTTDKSNLVAAINEVLQTLLDTCGDLDNLNTTDKSNLVAAINEVNGYNTPKVKSWYETVGNMVTLGADNTGVNPVDDIFDQALSDYDVIYFPAGTYHWQRQHNITSKKILGDNAEFTSDSFGLNAGSYNAYGGFNSTYPQMLWNVDGDNSYISGFKFLTDAGGIVIRADYCTVKDCYFDTRATIPGSTGYYGITIRDCSVTGINNCIFNMLDGNNRDGIHIEGPSNDITISNCFIYSGDDAIAINALEGNGGTINNVLIDNCVIAGYGMRFFGNDNTPVDNVNVTNCTLRVSSPSMTSGAVRFSNTLNTLGGTPIGGDFIVSAIKFDNCEFTADKAGDVSFYALNTKGTVKVSNSRFTHNLYLDDATVGSTFNLLMDTTNIIGTQINVAAATGNYYLNASQCEVNEINKVGNCNFTGKFVDCDIVSNINVSGFGANSVRIFDSIIADSAIVLEGGVFEIKNCSVPAGFTITNDASVYFVDNLIGVDDSSVFTAPGSADRITGNVIVSALPPATNMVNGDHVLMNNGYYPELYYIINGGWQKAFIGSPQPFSPISAAPTMTDFNDLVTALKATGVLY